MARLRFRFELKTGTTGVPLKKLANLASEFQRFLLMLGEDLGTAGLTKEWLAVEFYNGSVGFDIEHVGEVDERQAHIYSRTVSKVAAYNPNRPNSEPPLGLRKETLLQYAVFGQNTDPTDTLNLGFFQNGTREPALWQPVAKSAATAVAEILEQVIEYRGGVQGIIHALFKEANPPYFDIRELSKQQIVKCIYPPDKYRFVVDLLKNKDAVVLVAGTIRARRLDRKIEDIRIDRMRAIEPLSPEDFQSLNGAAPNLTGDLSTEEFIDRMRRTAEGDGED